MRRLTQTFVDSAFGYAHGRRVFIPFGVLGRQYVLPDAAKERALRRQLGFLIPVALLPLVALLSLFVLPQSVRTGLELQIFAIAGIGVVLFATVFSIWVLTATRGLRRNDATDPAMVPDFLDPHGRAATALVAYLERSVPSRNQPAAIGALAGFACQMGVRAAAAAAQRPSGLLEVALQDGSLRYFGDALNAPLAEATPSVWSILSDGSPLTPLFDLFRDSAAQAAGEDPEGAFANAVAHLVQHWPATAAILTEHDLLPETWHLAFARAGRTLLLASAGSPQRTMLALMRTAILASKADPAEILVLEPRR